MISGIAILGTKPFRFMPLQGKTTRSQRCECARFCVGVKAKTIPVSKPRFSVQGPHPNVLTVTSLWKRVGHFANIVDIN
jgi:hypothetical protein